MKTKNEVPDLDFNAATAPVVETSDGELKRVDAPAPVPENVQVKVARAPLRVEPARTALREMAQAPEGLERQRKAMQDLFYVPPGVIAQFHAAGWGLEWKRHTTMGEEDPAYQVALAENHWEPVTTDEIPGFMPTGHKGSIIRNGLMLMKRPKYLIDQAHREDWMNAKQQVANNEEQLGTTPTGTLARADKAGPAAGKIAPVVTKEFGSMVVPE